MKYILNSAVITNFGAYTYRQVSLTEVKDWLQPGDWVSTIGYPETATALSSLVGLPVPTNRQTIRMEMGDEALVFRLVLPPGTARIDPQDKGRLTPEFVLANCEMGILTRTN